MQRYTLFFITVNAVHVSGGFSTHHQELKNCTHSIWFVPGLLTATDILYYCQCCTCFGRFLRPSSGAQELYTQHLVCARLACCYRYSLLLLMLYMFRAVSPPIIRSARTVHKQHLLCARLACCYRYSLLLSMLYMFRAVSQPIIRSSRTVHTASGLCQACLLLPLAVAVSKPGTFQMLCVQFLSSLWWAEKPPETCTALTIIKNIV